MSVAARRWIRPVVGLLIAAAFVWLLWVKTDVDQVRAAVARLAPSSIGIALLCLAMGYAMRIVRWWWMLRSLDPATQLGSCAWPLVVSVAANNVLPFRAGDALRVFGFRQQLRTPPARLFGTLMVERLLDLLVLLMFFFVGVLGVRHAAIPDSYIHAAAAVAGVALLVWLIAALFGDPLGRAALRACHHPILAARGWTSKLEELLGQLLAALGVLRMPGLAWQLPAISVAVWAAEGGVFWSIAHGLDYGGSPLGPWFALATGTLATLIPSSPGYVGTFDFFAMSGLAAYGAEPASAAAFAFVVHVVLWLPLTALGAIYFLLPGAHARGSMRFT